jgi:small conductance mechanosensitive channel
MNINLVINSFSDFVKDFLNLIIEYSPRFVSAILILFIGIYAIRFINKIVKKVMLKRELDPTLSKFLADILNWALRILLFVTFISRLGIETSSFVAILGAAGLAVGLSLQGSLSNFAGGMLIILFKPFRVGDTIEAQNVTGTVLEIQIFVTKLVTANNQTIFIPNGILSNGVIINYSLQGIRRAELVFSLSYETDVKNAKQIVKEVLDNHPKVLKDPIASVVIKDMTDSAIHLSIRPWCFNDDFSDVASDILEDCKEAFDKAGIVVQPYIRENNK